VRRQPEGWLWAYKHWRHLPGGEDPAGYPFYAGPSGDFDALLKAEFAPGGSSAQGES